MAATTQKASINVAEYNQKQEQSTKNIQVQDNAIKTLKRYLRLTKNGNIVLNAPKKVIKEIGEANYNTLLEGVKQTNQMIDKGYLRSDKDFNITVTQKYVSSNDQLKSVGSTIYLANSQTTSLQSVTAAANLNKVVWYWWGFKVYLNSKNSNKIAAGSGILGVLAILIPDLTLSKAVAVCLGVNSGLYYYANAAGRGTYTRFNYAPPVTPLVFTGVFSQ